MAYAIRKAGQQDRLRMNEIYAAARQFMRDNGNHTQWGEGDRPEDLLEEDILQGQLYVLTEKTEDKEVIMPYLFLQMDRILRMRRLRMADGCQMRHML